MQNDQASLAHRVTLVEGATSSLINKTDLIYAEIKNFRSEVTLQLANTQQDLHLIIEMYQKQQEQLNRIEALLKGDK